MKNALSVILRNIPWLLFSVTAATLIYFFCGSPIHEAYITHVKESQEEKHINENFTREELYAMIDLLGSILNFNIIPTNTKSQLLQKYKELNEQKNNVKLTTLYKQIMTALETAQRWEYIARTENNDIIFINKKNIYFVKDTIIATSVYFEPSDESIKKIVDALKEDEVYRRKVWKHFKYQTMRLHINTSGDSIGVVSISFLTNKGAPIKQINNDDEEDFDAFELTIMATKSIIRTLFAEDLHDYLKTKNIGEKPSPQKVEKYRRGEFIVIIVIAICLQIFFNIYVYVLRRGDD